MALSGKPLLPRPCLMLVTEPHPNLVDVVASAVRGGVNVVQLRDKTAGRIDLLGWARDLRPLVPSPGLLIVNGDYQGVTRAGADGTQMPRVPMRAWATDGGRGLLGVSVHSVEDAQEAEYGGADYVVAGTVYASQSHPDVAPQGLNFLRELCVFVSIPIIAIGGITPSGVAECVDAGAAGVAVLSPIMGAADPEAMARDYRHALDTAWKAHQCS